MTTKYDVGDYVLLPCKVNAVIIKDYGITYSLANNSFGHSISVPEDSIYSIHPSKALKVGDIVDE